MIVTKQNESTNYDVNVHINPNNIRNIALNIFRYIRDKDYDTISTIKNTESGYNLVRWKIWSYAFQSSQELVKVFIRTGEFCV